MHELKNLRFPIELVKEWTAFSSAGIQPADANQHLVDYLNLITGSQRRGWLSQQDEVLLTYIYQVSDADESCTIWLPGTIPNDGLS